MAFHPKTTEPLEAAVRRSASRELERAETLLSRAHGKRRADAVHEARKHLKKVRALVKLVRFGLGDAVYRSENEWLRDAGRELAEVRDAQVLAETLAKLRRQAKRDIGRKAVRTIRAALLSHRRQVERRVLDRGGAIAKAIEALRAARTRAEDWRIAGGGWDVLGEGLRKTYRDGSDAFDAAYEDPTDERFHEWRKRAKDLWHDLQFLEPSWTAVFEAMADEAHRLGDVLGDEHDLAVLRGIATAELDERTVEDLVQRIDEQRAALQSEAHGIGSRLYVEGARAFVQRLGGYWRAWRVEG